MSRQLPLSVVVPVRDGASTLGDCLAAILASDIPRDDYELIVVDDSSADRSAAIAARYCDTVVRLAGKHTGSAYARNRGAEVARGDIVAFVNADTRVHANTLGDMLGQLRANSALGAVSAAHDAAPAAPNFMSQYWNLLLHFGDVSHSGVGASFGSGCGMVRRATLVAAGMYDEWRFGKGGLEGIELGQRLEQNGNGVLLSGNVRATSLGRFSTFTVLRKVWNRSALLSRSLGYQRTRTSVPGDVVFTLSRAAVPALATLGTAGLSAAFIPSQTWPIKATIAAIVILANLPIARFYARERGILFALAALPMHLVCQAVGALGLCVGWVMRDVVGDRLPDAATQAYAEVGVEIWPPVPRVSTR